MTKFNMLCNVLKIYDNNLVASMCIWKKYKK